MAAVSRLRSPGPFRMREETVTLVKLELWQDGYPSPATICAQALGGAHSQRLRPFIAQNHPLLDYGLKIQLFGDFSVKFTCSRPRKVIQKSQATPTSHEPR
jgi:hypothetical protein